MAKINIKKEHTGYGAFETEQNLSDWTLKESCNVTYGSDLFGTELEEVFYTSAYSLFLHFKRIGDYELLIDYRSRISKYDSFIRNIDRFRNFIKEIEKLIGKQER